ncbi:FkbM family methyltransferase [Nodularia spumigena CS-588/05]|uniref:FkbM family methyltransferase n=1 Tax=Nodularia spumigena TaxID=70799 RepID=UPI00233136D9|nr:FkbM family methyltransferase [Nodularia spumigena]MDB9354452.1 FkbM family methyltransferase [Nodularia spumigena CS-588/05]
MTSHPLASSNKLKAFRIFLHWQLHYRLANKSLSAFIFLFVENTKIISRQGETGVTGNIYAGLHEFVDMCLIMHFLSKEDLFFDIGANVGSYSLLAGGVSNSSVIALEPVSHTFAKLIENIGVNNLSQKVKCLQYAVGSSISQGNITIDNGSENKIISESKSNSQANTELINITTIDELSRLYGFPLAIKIDVEGYEDYAFEGASETLNNPTLSLIIIETVTDYIHEKISHAGFVRFYYNPYTRAILDTPISSCKAGNYIYIRNLDIVTQKVAESPPYLIHNMGIRI